MVHSFNQLINQSIVDLYSA